MSVERGELVIEGLTLPLALRFISGKYQGGEFPLPDSGEIVIGRSSELDMVLVEDMVSRRHARLQLRDGVLCQLGLEPRLAARRQDLADDRDAGCRQRRGQGEKEQRQCDVGRGSG